MKEMSPDTEVSLLLTSNLGVKGNQNVLTLNEYNVLVKVLVSQQMRPRDLLVSLPEDLGGLEQNRLERLLGRGIALAEARVAWANLGIWVLSRSDAAYPQKLREKFKMKRPPLIFGVGNPELLNAPGFGMVGSRAASMEVLSWTKELAAERVALGEVIVSGGAKGVDLAAMEGALDVGGSSVGVVASDLAKFALSKKFRSHIQSGKLLLISPFDPDARFMAWRAMDRNKYIYALSDQLVIASSAVGSGGTWAGAEENLTKQFCPRVHLRNDPADPGLCALNRLGLPFFGAQAEQVPSVSEWDRIREHLKECGSDGLKNIHRTIGYPGKEGMLKSLLMDRVDSGELERKRNGKFQLLQNSQTSLF